MSSPLRRIKPLISTIIAFNGIIAIRCGRSEMTAGGNDGKKIRLKAFRIIDGSQEGRYNLRV